ncbi:MAG TPA: hypothetical protein VH165_15265 [Kofleriaceae bacterium]|nr:hypothetical protein [Kofleriaceae bacterium]
MRAIESGQLAKRIVAGVGVSALAMFGAAIGCMRPVATSSVDLDVTNDCKAGDASHTIDPIVTCTYNVSSSSNTMSQMSAGQPYTSCGKWMVSCYISGIACAGSSTKTPLSCRAPEYLATNQDIKCGTNWTQALKGYLDSIEAASSDSSSDKPSPAQALQLCNDKFGSLLGDLNATANNLCNKVTKTWTNDTKKSAVCCIPAPPKPDAGVPVADARMAIADARSLHAPAIVMLLDAGAPLADAALPAPDAAPPADAGSDAPGDGSDSCTTDPGDVDDPPPVFDE